MATARTAAASLHTRADGLAWVCDLASHPVPTFVVRAQDGRLAVVEELPAEGRPSLARQAESLSRLNHPNLARVRSVSADPRVVEVVADYVKGESLFELEHLAGQRNSPIPLEIKLRIVVDVLNGLSALHGHENSLSSPASASGSPASLVHGNVRPENILVGLDGGTRLVRLLLPRSSAPSSYAAPELALSERDARADLFSVGVILERALSKAQEAEKLWAAPFAEVVARATKPNREARFATAAQMAAELRKIAKAKLASPLIVAAAVEEMAGDRIDARTKRCEAKAPVPSAASSGTARIGSFPEEAPTVPRRPAPELLRPPKPLPPLAPTKPKLPALARGLPPPSAKAPITSAPPAAEPLDVPPPPPEIAALAVPLAAVAPAPAHMVSAPAPANEASYVTENSEAAVEIAIPEPPPVDVLLLPLDASATDAPLASFKLGRARTKKIVFGVLAVAVMILVIAGVRSAARGQQAAATAVATSSPGEPTATQAPAAPPPAPAPAEPRAAASSTSSPEHAPPPPPVAPPETTPVTHAAASVNPTLTRAPPAAAPTPAKKPTSTAKPAATYDPLGI
jgi:eukaryotic-like serine/threonine-protein kinase